MKKPQLNNPEIKFYETEKFKKLNKKWQAKVQKAGHNELEMGELGGSNPYLKRWDATWFTNRRHGWQGTAEQMVYFQECTRFLNEYDFKTVLDKMIWECHTEGLTYTQTKNKLKKFKVPYALIASTVEKIRRDLLNELRYTQSERN